MCGGGLVFGQFYSDSALGFIVNKKHPESTHLHRA